MVLQVRVSVPLPVTLPVAVGVDDSVLLLVGVREPDRLAVDEPLRLPVDVMV